MNRYVFNVGNRVFEIHIQSPMGPSLYETTCFEVLEGGSNGGSFPLF